MPIFGIGAAGAGGKKVGQRSDPYAAYNFLVEIDGLVAAGFMEVTGLGVETEVERRSFGGENDIEYKFVKGTKFTDLTFKRGLTDEDIIWKWYAEVIQGKVAKKNGSVFLLDYGGRAVVQWDFLHAYPVKWEGPAFNAMSSIIATETLVLVHHGLMRARVR